MTYKPLTTTIQVTSLDEVKYKLYFTKIGKVKIKPKSLNFCLSNCLTNFAHNQIKSQIVYDTAEVELLNFSMN